ncbi:hypothetical protein RRG08_033886 [Elysia crispata]|uniref:Uncharacterized protein n=1 Tax=Elysia crispata TaxID=231223 RepID=A0AAE1B9C2_9GAST|nr:hypothetical protein RRG08_033886 [Elysia crispata]
MNLYKLVSTGMAVFITLSISVLTIVKKKLLCPPLFLRTSLNKEIRYLKWSHAFRGRAERAAVDRRASYLWDHLDE